MESIIDNAWQMLYANNPKIQAFGVAKDSQIIWQTSNWDLVEVVEDLLAAQESASQRVEISGVQYERIRSDSDTYISSADGENGHFLMARANMSTWLLAWAAPDSIPELTIIDLAKAALSLQNQL